MQNPDDEIVSKRERPRLHSSYAGTNDELRALQVYDNETKELKPLFPALKRYVLPATVLEAIEDLIGPSNCPDELFPDIRALKIHSRGAVYNCLTLRLSEEILRQVNNSEYTGLDIRIKINGATKIIFAYRKDIDEQPYCVIDIDGEFPDEGISIETSLVKLGVVIRKAVNSNSHMIITIVYPEKQSKVEYNFSLGTRHIKFINKRTERVYFAIG